MDVLPESCIRPKGADPKIFATTHAVSVVITPEMQEFFRVMKRYGAQDNLRKSFES